MVRNKKFLRQVGETLRYNIEKIREPFYTCSVSFEFRKTTWLSIYPNVSYNPSARGGKK